VTAVASAAYAVAYLAPAAAGGWPFDVGDDPAFRCSERYRGGGGALTWGVCRPDLRNAVLPGDTVVFFAAEATSAGRDYRLSGWATVSRKVSQLDVWDVDALAVYRGYENLLVRPLGDGAFVQHEHVRPWHPDWLWRLANPGRGAPRKARWVEAGRNGRIRDGLINVDEWAVRPARNYVLFEPEDGNRTAILADPPTVARAGRSAATECWSDHAVARELRQIIVTATGRDTLRTANPQQPHRHLRLAAPPDVARDRLRALQDRHRLALRA
jgi:hypothetical protein